MTTHPAVSMWLVVATLLAPRPQFAQQPPVPGVLSLTAAQTTPLDSAPATLVGRVVDSSGTGLSGAEISMGRPQRMRIITSDSGEFRITGLRPGSNVFDVRRLGFAAASFTAQLRPGKTYRVKFSLSVAPHPLPLVSVSDTASHWLDEFEARRGLGRGTFITRPEIVRMEARTGTDIVRNIPGIRVSADRNGRPQVYTTRGLRAGRACVPQMYVHNIPFSGTLEDFPADDIEALEVYVGVSEVPEQLDKDGRGYCGAIVVWTRDPKKAP